MKQKASKKYKKVPTERPHQVRQRASNSKAPQLRSVTAVTEPAPELIENNVIFLIGAGCSATAGVKMASEMVDDIDNLVRGDQDWKDYKNLYYYLKSAILYSAGITGDFKTPLNVERLVVVLTELGKKEQNIAYPFIGNWNTRLIEVAGENFRKIEKLQALIKKQLFEWINIGNYSHADYYSGFARFQRQLGYPIRVFSFNYDVCIEEVVKDVNLELGFDPKTKQWLYYNFEPNKDKDVGIFLYKLHGSIDWERVPEKGNILEKRAHPAPKSELIFGTDAKLASTDPYLYYVFEFRKFTLHEDCKLMIVIGYSFGDDYMNKLMEQALAATASRNLLIVDLEPDKLKNMFTNKYSVRPEQVNTLKESADAFLRDKLSLAFVAEYLPSSEEVPF